VTKKTKKRIDATALSLEAWLQLMRDPPKDTVFITWQFPTDEHREEFVSSIGRRSLQDVLLLLRNFLVRTGSLGVDPMILADYFSSHKTDPERHAQLDESEFIRRLIHSIPRGNSPPWEGITWILDLLPDSPGQTLEVLNAYLVAHAQWLPDGRLAGLGDASELVRSRFIGESKDVSSKLDLLRNLPPRQLECLVERLYGNLGYETKLTPAQSDGGRDVEARRLAPSKKEDLRIECKRRACPIGVEHTRRLLGVVASDKATKGVLVSTSGFTKVAHFFARRNAQLELISGDTLVELMNEHLGARWSLRIERLVAESLRSNSGLAPANKALQRTPRLPRSARSVRRR
jgi:restriction system protein